VSSEPTNTELAEFLTNVAGNTFNNWPDSAKLKFRLAAQRIEAKAEVSEAI
jgi:hypothetical protein